MKKYKDIFSLNENTLEIHNLKNGKVRSLTLNQFRLLECLIQGRGRKSEIIDYVWLVNNIVVSDGSYHQLIFQTRAVFDNIDLNGEMIKTFPRYGVKLVDNSEVGFSSDSDSSISMNDVAIGAGIEVVNRSAESQAINDALTSKKREIEEEPLLSTEDESTHQPKTNKLANRRNTPVGAMPFHDVNHQNVKKRSFFYSAVALSNRSVTLICSFLVGIGFSFFVLSPTFGFYIWKYIHHPPMIFSENKTTIFSNSLTQDKAKEGIGLLDKMISENKNSIQHSYRYGVMEDFYVYKTLILCQVSKGPRLWLSSGAICENYILDY